MATSAGPMLVASRDILTSVDVGPSRGRVIVGRRFDAAFVEGIGERTRIDLATWSLTGASVPQPVREALLGEGAPRLHTVSTPDGESLDVEKIDQHM